LELPEDLAKTLSFETTPGARPKANDRQRYEDDLARFNKPREINPSWFQVIAEAAVLRAKILLEIAASNKLPVAEHLRMLRNADNEQRISEDHPEDPSLREEFRRNFGERDGGSLGEVAEFVFDSINPRMSDNVRLWLLKKLGKLAETDPGNLSPDFPIIDEKGNILFNATVIRSEYPAFKRVLLDCYASFHNEAVSQTKAKGSSKGGKTTQARRKAEEAVTEADLHQHISKPSQKPNRET
jgi:hypothetical protein